MATTVTGITIAPWYEHPVRKKAKKKPPQKGWRVTYTSKETELHGMTGTWHTSGSLALVYPVGAYFVAQNVGGKPIMVAHDIDELAAMLREVYKAPVDIKYPEILV